MECAVTSHRARYWVGQELRNKLAHHLCQSADELVGNEALSLKKGLESFPYRVRADLCLLLVHSERLCSQNGFKIFFCLQWASEQYERLQISPFHRPCHENHQLLLAFAQYIKVLYLISLVEHR